jgi:hypothetical protein
MPNQVLCRAATTNAGCPLWLENVWKKFGNLSLVSRIDTRLATGEISVRSVIAVIVGEADHGYFLSPVEGKSEVNHKDANKMNARVDNLEWSTRSENMQHAWKLGLIIMPEGNRRTEARTIGRYSVQ